MNTRASIVIMSHLSDAQEKLRHDPISADVHIKFAKYLILHFKDTNKEIDANAEYKRFYHQFVKTSYSAPKIAGTQEVPGLDKLS